ncbi:hypothetical protein ABNO07_003515 [Salmonella enterica subsp. enterica serovar Bareilly]
MTRTFAPYSQKMAARMKVRAYGVAVTFPDGSLHVYDSMKGFAEDTGHILPHVRASVVWFEMEIGDTAENTWTAPDGGTYHFVFTRRK